MKQREGTFEILVAYASGDLDAHDADALEERIAASTELRHELAVIRQVIEALQLQDAALPREELLSRVSKLFRQRQQRPESVIEHAGRVIAQLVFDSRTHAVLPGFRGKGSGYHLMFSSEIGELDLHVTQKDAQDRNLLQVRGQVSANTTPLTRVRLKRREDNEKARQFHLGDRGQFRFDAEPGQYNVEVEMGQQTLVAEDVRLA